MLPACNLGLGSSSRSLDDDFLNSFAPRICAQRRFVAAVRRNVRSTQKCYLLAIAVSEARVGVSTGAFLIVLRCELLCSDFLLQRCGEMCAAREHFTCLYLPAISVSEAQFEVSLGTFLMICSADTFAQRGSFGCNFGGVSSS